MTQHAMLIEKHDGKYLLQTQVELPGKIDEVFDFFADASNLEALTPPYLHFQILTPQPIDIHAGTLIEYRLRLRGIPIHWRTVISDWEPTRRFVDQQQHGPYRLWRHEHLFEETSRGTLVIDRVEYLPPLAYLTNSWIVAPDLRKIFAYRREVMSRRFGSCDVPGNALT